MVVNCAKCDTGVDVRDLLFPGRYCPACYEYETRGVVFETRYTITYPDGRVRKAMAYYDDEETREMAAFDLMGTQTRSGGTITRAVFLSADGMTPCGEVEA